MKRIIEPELMEDAAQAQAYAEADFESAHSNFIVMFKEIFINVKIDGHVLDLGCGPGDITFRFARAFPNCIVHGLDGSDAMLHHGKEILLSSDDIKNRVELIRGFLPGSVLPKVKYDAVISNSLLHHFHNPQTLWDTIKLYAASAAPIFIMDLKRPETIDEAKRLVKTYAGNEPEILRHDFYHSLLAAFEIDEIKEQLNKTGLGHLSVKSASDRHVIIYGNGRYTVKGHKL